jgi:hypothetical protein
VKGALRQHPYQFLGNLFGTAKLGEIVMDYGNLHLLPRDY